MEEHFPEFPEKKTNSRGKPKFSNISCLPVISILLHWLFVEWFAFWKFNIFRNFWKLCRTIHWRFEIFKEPFLNSLIIHQVNTKKITTVKEVLHTQSCSYFTSPFIRLFVSFCFDWKIYQTLETTFNRLSKQLELRQKYPAARRIFNSLLGVWISAWNSVACVWQITETVQVITCFQSSYDILGTLSHQSK